MCSRRSFSTSSCDATRTTLRSTHDFGRDIIPYIVKHGRAVAHHFSRSCVRSANEQEAYWRDVGTVDAYWAANIDLTDFTPHLDLYDRDWPIWTYGEITPPAKFVHDQVGRRGQALSSLVSGGCIISGATLRRTLLFTWVRVNSYASVENAVILPYVDIGRSARLTNVVVDRGVQIPPGPRRRRRSGARRAPLQTLRPGSLSDHPADDRPAVAMKRVETLAVASEITPLVKTGGLADVAGRPARGAQGGGRRNEDADPRLRERAGGARRRAKPVTSSRRFSAARLGFSARARANWIYSSWTPRTSMPERAAPTPGATVSIIRTMRCASPALARAASSNRARPAAELSSRYSSRA